MRIEKHRNGKKYVVVTGRLWWRKVLFVGPGIPECKYFIKNNQVVS